VALEVGIVGAEGAGKTSLFTALTGGGGEYGRANLGMAAIADERLAELARVVSAKKVTPAALRVQDVPGSGPALLGNLRQVDALLAVLDGYSPGADPAAQLAELELELLFADHEHVQGRVDRIAKQAKSGDPRLRSELEALEEVLAWVDADRPLSSYPSALPAELEPLTTKPLLSVENGPGGVDLALEAELARLDPEEAAAFRDGGRSALEEVVRLLRDRLDLITFFTAGEKETRAWPLRRGATALDAAAAIHSDIARGFIRCEVIVWSDLVEAGSHREAARRALQRLEGKTYVVADGDVLNIRFNV
jgi:ribosome-binding ATPase YchF (GTP1/OBG family)